MIIMSTARLGFHFMLLLILFSPRLIPASTIANFPIAKPNCTDHCGNISIPYPFGTNENCYHDSEFLVTCNETSNPPQLFLTDSTVQAIDISLGGQLRILQSVGYDCYDSNGTQTYHFDAFTHFSKFIVNNTANKLIILGCDTYGFVQGSRGDQFYQAGCTAWCGGSYDLFEGTCGGLGCCEITSIPNYVWQVNLTLHSYQNYTEVSNISNCGYAFYAEEGIFIFHPENLTNFWDNNQELPMVVDWDIDYVTCEDAKLNSSNYACISPNSNCYDPSNGRGYRCNCNNGYQGNPYLEYGCQDIDECQDPTLNNCTNDCVNNLGGFNCTPCPHGYSGNGTGVDGCQDVDECDLNQHNCTMPSQCRNNKGGFSCACPPGYRGKGYGKNGCTLDTPAVYKLVAGVSVGVVLMLLVSCFTYFELKRRRSNKMKQEFFLRNGGILLLEKLTKRESSPNVAKIYSAIELEKATNNFHSNMIIGQGGYGTVYKGFLEDNTVVAVKKSKEVDSTQIEQFINEVFVLCHINHRNVVKLLGCCLETSSPLLVYEFISNGTLFDHIHDERKKHFLNWNMRLRIAIETANVLSYLHSAASIPIIHRDVKSANILLDHDFAAKVSDFGASRLIPIDQTELSTMVQGTFGYLDPEYMQTNQLTEKSDVYSFGVVLLELLTGRKPLSYDRSEKERNLTSFFLFILKQNRLVEIFDEDIVCEENMVQLTEVARLARGCLNVKGEDRPSMKEVAKELEGMNISGKHSWANNKENGEEIEFLLGEGLNGFDGYSASIDHDSLMDYITLPIKGGR